LYLPTITFSIKSFIKITNFTAFFALKYSYFEFLKTTIPKSGIAISAESSLECHTSALVVFILL
jgi:hypothetical protein